MADRFEVYHQELAAYLSECQVVGISGIVIEMNVWTWLEPAQEATPAPDDK